MAEVTKKGIDFAIELMKKGYLNRYQNAEYDYLLKTECALANYIGTKYALGVNSGASALFLCLKAIDIKRGDLVLTNAFTFNAVPSSIVHAGGIPILIECDEHFVMDTDHLINVLDSYDHEDKNKRPKILMLSYMRGRVPNMDIIMNIVNKYNLILIEDIAHAVGVQWNGKMLGTFGVCSAMSTQAHKILNSGEGGFVLTNDDDIQSKTIVSSGCYEKLYLRHNLATQMMAPTNIEQYIETYPNYSLRMTNLSGAILYPQIELINQRRDICNANFQIFCKQLIEECKSKGIEIKIPEHLKQVSPVNDSIQFIVKNVDANHVHQAVEIMKNNYHLKIAVFGHSQNARNPKSWKFLTHDILKKNGDLKNTADHLEYALDTRLSLNLTQQQISQYTRNIAESLSINVKKIS